MTDYQRYQLQWMIDHGYSLQDLMNGLDETQCDEPVSTTITELFNEWKLDRGFGSELWACEDEWKDCEMDGDIQGSGGSNYQDGDIYLNLLFGDLWVVDGSSFIKINNGYEIDLDEPECFVKVGHISGVINKKRNQPTKQTE